MFFRKIVQTSVFHLQLDRELDVPGCVIIVKLNWVQQITILQLLYVCIKLVGVLELLCQESNTRVVQISAEQPLEDRLLKPNWFQFPNHLPINRIFLQGIHLGMHMFLVIFEKENKE